MSLFTFNKRATAPYRCDPTLLYEILTDYDTFAEWLPRIARSKLLAKEGDLAIAELELLRPPKDMFVVECIHTKNKMVLWRTIRGRSPVTEVQWDIERGEEGQSRVTLTLEGKNDWTRLVPAYSQFLNPSRCLQALQARISEFLPELSTREDGEKILEISETAEGLICWMQGKKYLLTAAPEGKHD